MNTPMHPMLVHLPMALAALVPMLAFVLWLATWRGWLPARSWWLVTALQALLFGSGLLAMRSGEADEERVERVVAEATIEAHEHAAERFVWAAGLLLLLSGAPLLLRSRPALAQAASLATAFGSVVVLGFGYAVGSAGGELVYRHGAAAAFASGGAGNPAAPAAGTRQGDDDDDER
ncbi:MAG: hypothetical protein IT455_15720 [Planctomycetes bacterium]|nr:hypothetical protein [Planctomycetota bacterium]